MTAVANHQVFWLNYYTLLHHLWMKASVQESIWYGTGENELLVKKKGLWWRSIRVCTCPQWSRSQYLQGEVGY